MNKVDKSLTIETIQAETVFPVDTDLNRNALIFNIRPIPSHAIHPKNIKLLVTFKVLKDTEGKWVPIEPEDRITLYNGPAFSLFEDVHLTIAGTMTETSSREYSRTCFIRNMLFSDEREQKALQSALFMDDNPLFRNSVLKSKEINRGEAERSGMIENGNEITVIAPVLLDTLQIDALFPDFMSMVLRMYPQRSVNCLLQQEGLTEPKINAKVVITKAELQVPRYRINSIPRTLKGTYSCVRVLNYISPQSVMHFSRQINTNKLPKKLAIVILTEEQYHGLPSYSGHYFHHHNVNNVTVQCNGQALPKIGGMQISPSKKFYTEPYLALFDQLNAKNPPISLSNWDNGNAIFGISLESCQQSSGTCDISISFEKAPKSNLVILIFCYYKASYSIDKNGNFHSELTPKLQ